ncbi:MAG TPA: DUF1684 domain-containing protein [Candidatus Krumholzibacteria bacterium]|nr:DUF1684 domain-containing protein [Candidatus Krumholzibacteria bacterium]
MRFTWTVSVCMASAVAASALGCGGSTTFGGAMGGSGGGVGVSTGAVGAGTGGFGMARGKDDHKAAVEEWYRGRIQRLTKEDGYLSLVGLFPLGEGRHRFGSAEDNECVFPASAPAHAGWIVVENGAARLEPDPGARLMIGEERAGAMALATDKDGDPTEISLGTIKFYVIDRPGTLYLRVKDSESPVRKEFKGIKRYKVDRKWLVPAHLERYDPPKKLTVPNVMGFDEVVDCPGVLVFSLRNQEYRLEPLSESEDDMWIVFGDATNGHDTYGGGRFVYIPAPDAEGNTVIDFNRSYNPPCVFTPFATCPLPTRENVLSVKIEAGEKMWGGAH